jgi:CDP-glycerol glycerophosphotransferase (TagB/SpsB family)
MNRYINIVLKFIGLPFLFLVRYLVSFSRRDNSLWVFGAWNGQAFSDNTKYYFLYINDAYKEITPFWVTANRDVLIELKKLNLPVLYLYSFSGILTCLRAGKQFTTHSNYDISPVFTNGATHYCLFHATFPIKQMEFSILKNTMKKKITLFINKPFVFDKVDFSICSSSYTRGVIQSALDIDSHRIFETKLPRSEYTKIENHLITDLQRIDSICDFNQFTHFIYFVPTFRDDKSFNWFDFDFNERELTDFLESTNSVLVFRFHPFELSKVKKHTKIKSHRIIFEAHGLSDPYPLLSRASILVTDYSSIFADFLLLDKPIIFANFDHESYVANERSLYWNYEDVTPGYKVCDWSELIHALSKLLVEKDDSFVTQRIIMKKKIFSKASYESLSKLTELINN